MLNGQIWCTHMAVDDHAHVVILAERGAELQNGSGDLVGGLAQRRRVQYHQRHTLCQQVT